MARKHQPHPMPLTLDPEQQGIGVPRDVDERLWVVICRDCGDLGGRAEQYSEVVQQLRRPLGSLAEAQAVAAAHMSSAGEVPVE